MKLPAQTNTNAEKPTPTRNFPPVPTLYKTARAASGSYRRRYPERIELALLIPLAYMLTLGYGVAGGVAAAAVFAHMERLPYSREILGSGAIGGLVISATLHVQILNAAIIRYLSKSQVTNGLSVIIVHLLIFQLGLSFSRTLITALALVSRFHVQSKKISAIVVLKHADLIPKSAASIYRRHARCTPTSIGGIVYVLAIFQVLLAASARIECFSWIRLQCDMSPLW
jgi:hypothetical protein